MDETVLAYIFKDDKVLMLYRNKEENDINKNKWVGVGGHLEKGESRDSALIREVKEETNLDVTDYKFLATLIFINNDYKEKMYLYRVDGFTNSLKECDEGELKFINIKDLLSLNMWDGDRYFLDLMLKKEPYFEMELVYSGDSLIRVTRTK